MKIVAEQIQFKLENGDYLQFTLISPEKYKVVKYENKKKIKSEEKATEVPPVIAEMRKLCNNPSATDSDIRFYFNMY